MVQQFLGPNYLNRPTLEMYRSRFSVELQFSSSEAAARYLGICEDTLKKISDLGQLRAFMNGRRAYRLEDLDAYVESLPGWYDSTGEKSAKAVGERRIS